MNSVKSKKLQNDFKDKASSKEDGEDED